MRPRVEKVTGEARANKDGDRKDAGPAAAVAFKAGEKTVDQAVPGSKVENVASIDRLPRLCRK